MDVTAAGEERKIYTVSRLNRAAKLLLAECFGTVWVEGEVSNLAAPSSGHLYFTLKDADAQVRCALFRPQARLLHFRPENGQHVLARAQVSLYEPRGDYQLVVDRLEPAGDGALQRAFEALKQKLAAEGLFDQALKKPVPRLPQHVGVVTSPTGAAIRDILSVLKRRFPAIPVTIFPAKVQGSDAPADVVRAIQCADRSGCDVLILARGGGSLEDLWAFNDERVARAIHACATPIVSGVGHEVDFTIADFVADLRAATPSAAAEAVAPDKGEWLGRFQRLEQQLLSRWRDRLGQQARMLAFLDKRLLQQHPAQRLRTRMQRLDELELRLKRAMAGHLHTMEQRLQHRSARLQRHDPQPRLAAYQSHIRHLHHRLILAVGRSLQNRQQSLARLSQALQAVSPLATLGRGYAIAIRQRDGAIIRSYGDVVAGDQMETRLAKGRILSRIEETFDQ